LSLQKLAEKSGLESAKRREIGLTLPGGFVIITFAPPKRAAQEGPKEGPGTLTTEEWRESWNQSESRKQKAESRKQKAESRKQKAKSRKQKAEDWTAEEQEEPSQERKKS